MKNRKELFIVLGSLFVVILSVTLAYFTTEIFGSGKEISVESTDLKIIFTSGTGTIAGTEIEPGWSSGVNTFTVKNESNDTYKYNIVIKDLVNTFVTKGYLLYKITSTDGGYTMSDFVDVPKSTTQKDTVLAYSVEITKGATHTYSVEFKYENSTTENQNDDMGKKLSGTLFIEKGTTEPILLYNKILADNPTISTRSDFSTPFTTNTLNTLYKSAESGTDVYYFAGVDFIEEHCEYNGIVIQNVNDLNKLTEAQCLSEFSVCQVESNIIYGGSLSGFETTCDLAGGALITVSNGTWISDVEKPINNWVKFGKYKSDLIKYRGFYDATTTTDYREYSTMEECTSASNYNYNCTTYKYASTGDPIYWRIIRTNADGSIRLLYSGTSTDTTEGHIGQSKFNTNRNSPKYVGYMYGDDDSTLDKMGANTNDSPIKTYINNWYENNFTSYTNYLSNDAIYCNDRGLASGSTYSTSSRFDFKSYERLSTNKAPTYDCPNNKDAFSVNNTEAKLTYPIALMTADEVAYAGGVYSKETPMWYYTNSAYNKITGYSDWWLLSPSYWQSNNVYVLRVCGSSNDCAGTLNSGNVINAYVVRPVVSLKTCTQWKSGNGSSSSPYEIVENGGC